MGAIQNVARSIDNVTRRVWDRQGTLIKALILLLLIISGVGIPIILLALVARLIVEDSRGSTY
ncbi:hypothetical protein AUR64_06515 [Haloprofundus marisrubri]|uniref:Uncharacterized protein n=1 Tax=Haloprofundus marisrubri TaxID=1514971 RepID=A0A0W1RBR3_9EURY|nr:hypothetical protein [Haloprofundus marisrubri]KTG10837.1 hypothetical protein AUR64_06515 [Haloprofundus marisrubri]